MPNHPKRKTEAQKNKQQRATAENKMRRIKKALENTDNIKMRRQLEERLDYWSFKL